MKKYELVRRELMVVERAAWWNPRVRRILKAAPLVVLFLLLNTRGARASCSFNPTPDPTADGAPTSLRAAIQAANASGQDCLIRLQAGTYTLTIKNTNGQENNAAEGDLDITDSGHTVTIQGQGAKVSIVNGGGVNGIDDRVFQVLSGANAVFRMLTIEGGVANDDGTAGALPGTTESEGGGILVQDGGHVTLSRIWLIGNQAIGGKGQSGFDGGPGEAAAGGGLFLSSGAVDLKDSDTSGNAATGGVGGMAGTTVTQSSFCQVGGAGGGGAAAGGGLYVLSGSAALLRSIVSSNSSTGGVGADPIICHSTKGGSIGRGGNGGAAQGGGLFVGSGHISLSNSTFFANTAKGGSGPPYYCIYTSTSSRPICAGGLGGNGAGGGLYINSGSVSLTGDTVASNQALEASVEPPLHGSSSGGGIANAGATSLVTNTTLIGNNTQDSGNVNNGDDVSGAITSSHSLFGQTAGAAITNDGENIGDQDPLLDPSGLQWNGGPTQTVALEIGSPAIDTGDNAVCAAPEPTGLGGVDQRGYSRFPHGDNHCDIGAFEFYNLLVHPKFELFAPQPVGQQSQPRNLFITNNQTTSVALAGSIGGADPDDFIENGNCGATLAADASCTIAIVFKPTATGNRSAVITVSDSPDRTSTYTVKLTGEGK
jgi:hypothetical protein